MDKKNVIARVVIIALLCAVIAAAKDKAHVKKIFFKDDMPRTLEQKILSFDLANYAEDGRKKWLLRGDSADIFAEIVNLRNISMETYDEPKMTVTALKGDYDTKNKKISLYEDVVVLTSDGATLTTEFLKWHGNTDTITTDKPVRITRSDVIADGRGAQAFPQMKRIMLKKNVKVRLAKNVIKDHDENGQDVFKEEAGEMSPKAVITCNGPLIINYEENIAVFKNDVLVDDKKGKIYSDKMEAFLDPASKNIVRVIASGNVKVVQGEDTSYSEKAVYTTEDQRIVLLGRPRIVIRSEEEIEKVEEGLGGAR